MNRTELLDGLYATRRELLRLAIGTSDPAERQKLVERRDEITWLINSLIDAEQLASMADLETACAQIDSSVTELQHLTGIAKDIDSAITITKKTIDIAGSVIAAAK
jgi:hypothetical protein